METRGPLVLDCVPSPALLLSGPVGQRVENNINNWVKVAPRNNPGLLEMFARRDDGRKKDLVPWAGEFVGKYLIAAVQSLRMSEDADLKKSLESVVERLLQLQAEDGYLGPWPKQERLRGHWDLWGHYHIMLGLMLWNEQTGDEASLMAARRIADLICDTCLDTDFRVIDAGSHEMNMSVIHGLARLHRKTGDSRYLRMVEEILEDFEKAGDYYRTGLEGKEFFRTPRPRWESLHALQGLVEFYQITGDPSYKTAFLHHWASMRRFDYRNTGGFSSGERATGNPYRNDAIETCCVVAFEEVMIDALRLTGWSTIADDLELTTLNAMLGAQHPSGTWCTYNTPMAGERIPSHIHIRFQAREDTPHLNCCSVNGPRGYGSISRWGIMRREDGLAINYYGPLKAEVTLADGTPVTIVQETDYPVQGNVVVRINVNQPKRFKLALRIPAWSAKTQVAVNATHYANPQPGNYLMIDRQWQAEDTVALRFDMRVRYVPGDLEQYGKASLYRGPILLALDDRFPTAAEQQVDLSKLARARVEFPSGPADAATASRPWMVVNVPSVDGGTLPMIDFANAGATTVAGEPVSSYTTWIAAAGARPPAPVAWYPSDRSAVGPGAIRFVWRRPAAAAKQRQHRVVIAEDPTFERISLTSRATSNGWLLLPPEQAKELKPGTPYYWKVIASNSHGTVESRPPHKQFVIDPDALPIEGNWPYGQRETDQMITTAELQGDPQANYGKLLSATGWKPALGPTGATDDAVQLSGDVSMIKYKLLTFPEDDYSVSICFCMTATPSSRYGQVFSAWAGGMDDPLRIVVQEGQLFARIEAGSFYGTSGYPIQKDRWYHVAVVKQGTKLTLYVDGQARASTDVPASVVSSAADFAIGGNPNFSGPEFLPAKFADLKFYARALSAAEVRAVAEYSHGDTATRR
jgi:DUF1680 family protein